MSASKCQVCNENPRDKHYSDKEHGVKGVWICDPCFLAHLEKHYPEARLIPYLREQVLLTMRAPDLGKAPAKKRASKPKQNYRQESFI